ncbi:ATP-dependent DNA helicase RecG [Moheibacter lacus]|uniref:ATP-dependent DNA helicase RecG n=1 Tax=Moheibacter lacus TaxID=2745851 RepID=A0A838ZMV1_9FLAO|nr:ATP-dependent DNA helicase RecG [Moheibacter lacus]MBA5629894.1 ATP-dependent DNA helicase RecG [Moheibacter lacus]
MAGNILKTPIDYLNGVGPERAKILQSELGIYRFEDLLNHFPFRYIDRSKYFKINEILPTSAEIQIIGKIKSRQEIGQQRGKRLVAIFQDETGEIELVWFRFTKWLKETIQNAVGKPVVIYGKPNEFNRKYSIVHPELETLENHKSSPLSLFPVYSSTEKLQKKGITNRVMQKLQLQLFQEVQRLEENLSDEIIQKFRFPKRLDAYRQIHFPKNLEELKQAENRLKFEEFFFLQLGLLVKKLNHQQKFKSFEFDSIGDHFNEFYSNYLPFELTNAQKRVVKEIRADLARPVQMNRLLQGDVGSGKTMVALLSALIAIDNGYQVAFMAPTEILAQQHYQALENYLGKMDLKIGILSGSTKTKERREILEDLATGKLEILVGTHALLEEKVVFQNLGLTLIDEQHKFGVAQRAQFLKKNKLPPHVLVMTATPIPRTLAMSLYGDLDISVLDELPPGRKSIQTVHKKDKDRLALFKFMKDEIQKGRQVYVVYPLIEESEKLDYKDLMDGFESISRAFPLPDFAVSIVHGKMKPADKDFEMQRFVKGQTQILVATTVIEVGVNVPNASVMVIESAEKFGLSQLHQLRGRVGRGAEQSYCILMTKDQLNEDAYQRISTMVRTNDGFEVAEVDMQLRGPGNLMGTQQSGVLNFKLANLTKDQKMMHTARFTAEELLKNDPQLEKIENQAIKNHFQKNYKETLIWSRIG